MEMIYRDALTQQIAINLVHVKVEKVYKDALTEHFFSMEAGIHLDCALADTRVTLATRIGMMPMLLVLLDVRLTKLGKLLMGKCRDHGV